LEKTIHTAGRLMNLDSPKIMGILNITPDSFYGRSRVSAGSHILHMAETMLSDGADVLDVGGVSTRPGSDEVSEEEELQRLIPGIQALAKHFPKVPLSVDTFRSRVAREAVAAGASWINDISGGTADPAMMPTAAELKVPYVLMHMRGTPQTMHGFTTYDALAEEVMIELAERREKLLATGIHDLILDPGFGFSKTVEQNFSLLNQLSRFTLFGHPILIGISRKSMIWRTLRTNPEGALNGTTALHMAALMQGADILRVHDVPEAAECVRLFSHLRGKT
jgi:dihydropteroate synthase